MKDRGALDSSTNTAMNDRWNSVKPQGHPLRESEELHNHADSSQLTIITDVPC